MMAILGVGCVYLGDLEAGVGHGVPHHGHDLGGELPLLLPGCVHNTHLDYVLHRPADCYIFQSMTYD